MNGLSELSVLSIGGNESHEHDLATHGEELAHFGDTSDVLSTVFGTETEVFVKTTSDDITV